MARLLLLFVALAAVCVSKADDPIENRELNIQPHGGDIILTEDQRLAMEALSNPDDPFAPMHAVVRNENSKWPNGIVYYVYDSSITAQARTVIETAMSDYETYTCIRFRPRTNQADYVRFFRGQGCYSYIGRIGGSQDISIGRGCDYKGIVMHEIFHALGRWHEQSRPDRDQYVQIITENIESGFESNFEKLESRFVTTQGVTYDYGSVMHYGAGAFSSNGRNTIVPTQPGVSANGLGQRQGFSNSDIQHVLALYCNDVAATWSSWSSWSSCSQTCNGGTRSRVRSCTNGGNCEGANIDTEVCSTESCPIEAVWGSWSSWSGCSASCGGGRQSRQRECVGGNTCSGIRKEYKDCNTVACPDPPVWASWGSWSSCSATCAGGTRSRTRRCLNGNTCPGSSLNTESCNQDVDCNPAPELLGEIHIGCYLVPSTSPALKLLENSTPDLSDDPFTRTDPVPKCGLAATKQNYSAFGVSVGYCISGSSDLAYYTIYHYPGYCTNGDGGIYYAGRYTYFFMDVYQVVDISAFTVSADQALNPQLVTSPPPSSPPSSSPADSNDVDSPFEASGVDSHRYSLVLLSISLVTVLAMLFL